SAMKSKLSTLPPLVVAVFLLAAPVVRAAEPVNFQRDIRPLLSNNCFKCHGQDDQARKGKLRLDTRDDALKGGKSGEAALVQGKPDGSELSRSLATTDPKSIRPPPSTGKKLTAAQIDLLRSWVAQGGHYQQHWAFVPPRRPAVPAVKDAGWVRNPID